MPGSPRRFSPPPGGSAGSGLPRRVRPRWRAPITMATVFATGAAVGLLAAQGGGATGTVAGPAMAAAPELANGKDPNATVLSGGAQWWIWSPGPGELGANPQAFSFDQVVNGKSVKRVGVGIVRNEDTPDASLATKYLISENSGQIFNDYSGLPSNFSMVAPYRLRNGDVLSSNFVPTANGDGTDGFAMFRSSDVGKTWTEYRAKIVEDKWQFGWYRIHRDMLELDDGTLLLGAYGNGTVNGVRKGYSLILQSTDGGKTWTQRSAVNGGTSYSTNELGFGRTSDGKLVALMRGDEPAPRPPAMPLTQAFSDDDGKTWRDVKPYVPPAGFPNNGIMPKPMLMPNGQLLLTYGRPDNNVVVSRDGTGRTWDEGNMLYSRYPGEDPLRRWMGSSGNMDIVQRTNSTALAFGDRCHNVWMCREYSHDNAVWAKVVDAKGPNIGKIDLITKANEGVVKVSGSVAAADARFPEQRLQGAIDGSGEYRAAARFSDRAAAARGLTVELDKAYPINRFGLMMGKGEPGAAKVQFSMDGKTWGRPVRTGMRTDYAMRYNDFAPQQAKFVRITGDGTTPLTAVTELELYAAGTYTFENDAVGSIPRGLKDTRYALTADVGNVPYYQHSKTRLALQDNDQTARAQATIPNPTPGATQQISFGYEGWGYGSGAIWEILGKDASGKEVVADRLLFAPVYNPNRHVVKQWDGAAWQVIGEAGPFVPNKGWMTITLNSTGQGTTITKDGTTMGTSSKRLAQVTQFTGLRVFTGEKPEDVGNMEHSYDDITFGAS
ncbi:exo-alpha-sialidase [Nakamurella aerolata]|uniref:F5/8 type C domain-containing protein n=1 Tax=Nakamurella aerolata TaxID=1656892 RepID=A0A849ACA3_9ACTN|nr:exo-alpha-sialidase [Nakamurella aerolata]NNG36791.1 hypothetical protein [Nakamurella aerolata]